MIHSRTVGSLYLMVWTLIEGADAARFRIDPIEALMTRFYSLMFLIIGAIMLSGCDEGPFGNNAPQGRPDWMKDRKPVNSPNN